MNRYKNLCIIHLFILMGFVLQPGKAQDTTAELLVGTWHFDAVSSFATIAPSVAMELDSLPALKAQVMGSYTGREFSVFPNGVCTLTLSNGQSNSCSWSLSNDGTLTFTDAAGNTQEETIQLTANRLVRVLKGPSGTNAIVQQQHFIKN